MGAAKAAQQGGGSGAAVEQFSAASADAAQHGAPARLLDAVVRKGPVNFDHQLKHLLGSRKAQALREKRLTAAPVACRRHTGA